LLTWGLKELILNKNVLKKGVSGLKLAVLIIAFFAVIAYRFAGESDATELKSRPLPLIDINLPVGFETATFALG